MSVDVQDVRAVASRAVTLGRLSWRDVPVTTTCTVNMRRERLIQNYLAGSIASLGRSTWGWATAMRQQVSKVSAHVETLLDLMLDAWGKWALLEPILKDRTTIAAWGGGKRGRALDGIRRSLMHVCILDIAHVAFEPDDRSPSVEKVLHDIANPSTLKFIGSS